MSRPPKAQTLERFLQETLLDSLETEQVRIDMTLAYKGCLFRCKFMVTDVIPPQDPALLQVSQ